MRNQTGAQHAQQARRGADLADQGDEFVSTRTLMRRYDFPSVQAVRQFAWRRRFELKKVGRRVLFRAADFEKVSVVRSARRHDAVRMR